MTNYLSKIGIPGQRQTKMTKTMKMEIQTFNEILNPILTIYKTIKSNLSIGSKIKFCCNSTNYCQFISLCKEWSSKNQCFKISVKASLLAY